MKILILPGDGIGPEIVSVAEAALQALDKKFSLGLSLNRQNVGLSSLKSSGVTITEEVAKMANSADGVVLGPASTCLLYTSPSPRDRTRSRMPSSA